MGKVFYDEQITAATIDHLVYHSYVSSFDNQSHRIRNLLVKDHSQNWLGDTAGGARNNRGKTPAKSVGG
jgi:hypothetical protein